MTTILETPCREWQGARHPRGYGQMKREGRSIYVHRWVSEQIDGPIPDGVVVMHRCDNPPCFRYDHLVRGTQKDNLQDMASKGRATMHNAAKTHCREGHPYDEANTYHLGDGSRRCKICNNASIRRRRARAKLEG